MWGNSIKLSLLRLLYRTVPLHPCNLWVPYVSKDRSTKSWRFQPTRPANRIPHLAFWLTLASYYVRGVEWFAHAGGTSRKITISVVRRCLFVSLNGSTSIDGTEYGVDPADLYSSCSSANATCKRIAHPTKNRILDTKLPLYLSSHHATKTLTNGYKIQIKKRFRLLFTTKYPKRANYHHSPHHNQDHDMHGYIHMYGVHGMLYQAVTPTTAAFG